jgi:hypothetical protein
MVCSFVSRDLFTVGFVEFATLLLRIDVERNANRCLVVFWPEQLSVPSIRGSSIWAAAVIRQSKPSLPCWFLTRKCCGECILFTNFIRSSKTIGANWLIFNSSKMYISYIQYNFYFITMANFPELFHKTIRILDSIAIGSRRTNHNRLQMKVVGVYWLLNIA